MFNGHIQGEDFLDTAKIARPRPPNRPVNFSGDKLVSVDGNLTIKGVTKPVTLTVTSFLCMHPALKREVCGRTPARKIVVPNSMACAEGERRGNAIDRG